MDRKSVSILIPCYNEEQCLSSLFEAIEPVCANCSEIEWTLIFVNDGSCDATKAVLQHYLRGSKSWCHGKIIDLSRNFGKEAALIAGLDYCKTDACIIMDADLQDPPELIPEMVSEWLEGSQIVSARRDDRSSDGPLKRFTAQTFYKVFRQTSKLDIEIDASDFRLLDKVVIEAIRNCRESIRFTKGFFAWAGFSSASVGYARPKRLHGKTKWGGWKLWNYALDGIFNFSTAPLKIWSYVGLTVTLLSFLLAGKIFLQVLFNGVDAPGYASIFIAVTFLGGIQLMGIGIIGEYLGRTYIESKRRPIYLVKDLFDT